MGLMHSAFVPDVTVTIAMSSVLPLPAFSFCQEALGSYVVEVYRFSALTVSQ
jgi:hypothetical protein